ncbi:MAG: MFS transporter [Candidatus Odinarchaeota archaeon]
MNVRPQLITFMSLAHFFHHYMLYAFPALLLLIKEDIPLTYTEIGVLGMVPVLIMAITSPAIGWMSKKVNVGFSIVLTGIFLFALSSFFLSFANSFIELLIGNLVLGLGACTYHPLGLGVCANCYRGNHRGKALSVNHASGVLGTAISPVGSLAIAIFILANWRAAFLVLSIGYAIIGLIMVVWQVFQRLVQKYTLILESYESSPANPQSSDRLTSVNVRKTFKSWILVTVGVLLAISALRSGVYRSFSYFFPVLLNDFYGVSDFDSGLWASLILLAGAISDIYGAAVSDRQGPFGRLKMVILSAIGTSLAIILIIALTITSPEFWMILLAFGIFSIMFYLSGGTLQALMSDIVPASQRSFLYGLMFSIGPLLSSISPIIFGMLLDLFHSPVGGLYFMFALISFSFVVSILFWKRLGTASRNGLLAS